MVRNLNKYTKFQLVLFRLHFIICTLFFVIPLFFLNQNTWLDTLMLYITIIASMLILMNDRKAMFLRVVYLSIYTFIAFQYGLHMDVFIKTAFYIPFAMLRIWELYFTHDRQKWRQLIVKDINSTRKNARICDKNMSMGTFFVWLVIGVCFATIINDIFEDSILIDKSIGDIYYIVLLLVAFGFIFLDYRKSMNRWTFGVMYNILTANLWIHANNVSVAMGLYICFWIYYTSIGTIEAIYLREINKVRSLFALNLREVKDPSKKRK